MGDEQKSERTGKAVPMSVLTDSYKAGHFLMYPEAQKMTAYGEFRTSFEKDPNDHRFVFYGMRYMIENYISVQWTVEDVERAATFYSTHNAGNTEYPFPKDLFLKFIKEHNGYFPVTIEALPEGTVANVHVPVYQITAEGEYSRLATFLETILTQVWYPCNVATLSRRCKEVLAQAFDETVDDEMRWLLESRLHDFGFRGAACVEQSIIGGCAHLLNFTGSDTMSAGFYAQFELNNGKPVAQSVPASEHSVMTSFKTEEEAIRNMVEKFDGPGKVFSVVMDSYNYSDALTKILPKIAEEHKKAGGLFVVRPDSGDPVDCIMEALREGEKIFGAQTNKKGFKVLNGLAALQGDGINFHTIVKILAAVKESKYSAQNCAFGMGGGLLQKHNRDTMSFATKLNYIKYKDGTSRLVMKQPKTDKGKFSFPGMLKVVRVDGVCTIFPREPDEEPDPANELKVVYDKGPVKGFQWDSFDTVKARVEEQWSKCPKLHNVISADLQKRIDEWRVPIS